METIKVTIFKEDVYDEVAKATDYTGAKLIDGDENARDRILATDADLATVGRFWDETVMATNERFKEMLVSGKTKTIDVSDTPIVTPTTEAESASSAPAPAALVSDPEAPPPATLGVPKIAYVAEFEVSKSFDKGLTGSVESSIRSFFISSIIGSWFKYANKGEAADYFSQGAELLENAERLLFSRKRPTRPTD